MSALTLYETMSDISEQMVQAAQANDWEQLIVLERRVAGMRDTLLAANRASDLTTQERERKAALIQRILADDAEVRRHTEPWMEQVRCFLGAATQGRLVRGAYGEPTG